MKFSTNDRSYFAASLSVSLLLSVASISFIPAACAAEPVLADDTLLVLLAQHTNRSNARASLLNQARANTVSDIHVDSDDYSILQVQGPAGEREATFGSIQSMQQHHPEILSVSRNYLNQALLGSHGAGTTPNDPDFSKQWPLAAMRWSAGRALYGNRQRHDAFITIVGGGTTPVSTSNELGAYITQYNALSSTATPVQEPVSGTGAEGDIDSSVTGALTDNGVDIAGAACFVHSKPCHITMLQVTTSNGADNARIFNALAWAINNQHARGGPGPINLSYGGAKLGDNTEMQTLGQSLLNQGDILVLAAGDTNGEVTTLAHPYQPGSVVAVQATANDATNSLCLSEVVNDPAAAPGAIQPALISGQFNDSHFGSSFSAPLWCASIAMLISMHPGMTGAQAHAILLSTGTAGSGGAEDPNPPHNVDPTPTWNYVIPAFDRAIEKAIR
jgi:hypothetical protein